ncbi:hypothetical protein [Edwardsiella ictaluri]|uniref:Uncharacterized protein n=1 Tax=Edwardsiella ictaluri TaxID=67780 RepID=A0ABY8GGU2_EDWIC|nr:hypothetical protein [Edwardsiella ictaluri]WFN96532.1 hypothetical protein MAY91_17870 [Edwardsiella ictaluri]
MGRQKWLSGFPELLTDDFSCHAYYVGIDVIRINSVLLAALNLSGVTMGMDARTTMSSAPDEPKKPLGFSEPFFV